MFATVCHSVQSQSIFIQCFSSIITVSSDTVLFLQCVFAQRCYSAELRLALGGLVAGSLDSPRASLAAAARLSPVSLSVDAAARPSAFTAHLAQKRPDMYMTDLGASTPSHKSRRPLLCQPVEHAVLEIFSLNILY